MLCFASAQDRPDPRRIKDYFNANGANSPRRRGGLAGMGGCRCARAGVRGAGICRRGGLRLDDGRNLRHLGLGDGRKGGQQGSPKS